MRSAIIFPFVIILTVFVALSCVKENQTLLLNLEPATVQQFYLSNGTNPATVMMWKGCIMKYFEEKTGQRRWTDPCETNDVPCLEQQWAYGACKSTTQSCKQFDQWLDHSQFHDILDRSYFQCQSECKPDQKASQKYYDRLQSELNCAYR